MLKYPILVVAIGLAAAVHYVYPYALDSEKTVMLEEKIQKEFQHQPKLVTKTNKTKVYFQAILETESGNQNIGVHPDGISWGPAGLTRIALQDVLNKVPACQTGYDGNFEKILKDPMFNRQYGEFYFLDLVHRFGDVRIATIAYHEGPTKIATLLRKGKTLPQNYLQLVEKKIKE